MTHQYEPQTVLLARDRQTDRTEQTANGFLLPSGLSEEFVLPIMANSQTGTRADSSDQIL